MGSWPDLGRGESLWVMPWGEQMRCEREEEAQVRESGDSGPTESRSGAGVIVT